MNKFVDQSNRTKGPKEEEAVERFVLDMQIVLLVLALMLVESIVFRKVKPWIHLLFWIVSGFSFACYFS